MKTFALLTRVLCATQAAAMIAGCGGSQSQAVTPDLSASASGTHSKQFGYTGRIAYFRVPTGVVTISVDALGSRGGGFGGKGGRVVAMLPVTPGERLAVVVGGEGSGTSGGFNGGANGGAGMGSGSGPGYGGGGASDVRQGGSGLSHRVLVAAGGGGLGGGINGGTGGAGGAQTGGAGRAGHGGSGGNGGGGSGGTQVAGGIGGAGGYSNYNFGANGYNGTLGSGGAGGPGCVHSFCEGGGGGGAGGGYYGGGGGGSGAVTPGSNTGSGGGGGGGSSYAESTAKNVQFWRGWRNATGNGEITISWR